MKLLANISFPRLYSLIGCTLEQGFTSSSMRNLRGQSYIIRRTRYRCNVCHTDFVVSHQQKPGMSNYYDNFGDNYVICPSCGHAHLSTTRYSETEWLGKVDKKDKLTEPAPIDMNLFLYETKAGFTLRAAGTVIQMDDGKTTVLKRRIEEFRFDVSKRRTTYTVYAGQSQKKVLQMELGNPFDDTVYKDSMLRHICSESMAFKNRDNEGRAVKVDHEKRHAVTELLKQLREGIGKKWKALNGYPLKSLFVSTGQTYGALLFPLMNMAWRLVYPDAKNLPKAFAAGIPQCGELARFRRERLLSEDAVKVYTDFEAVRKVKGSVKAVIEAFHLPDVSTVRRILTDDIFRGPELQKARALTDNVDYMVQMFQSVDKGLCTWNRLYGNYAIQPKDRVYELLQMLRPYWSTAKLVQLVKGNIESFNSIHDIHDMMRRLTPDRRKEIQGIRPRDLHDWLVGQLEEQKEEGFELPCPDSVKKRLAMQLDNGMLKTFLPKHSHDLDHASAIFHNCVRTYSEKVLNKELNIVLMTDDTGRMLACLEVRDGALVQAKLRYNKPVKMDGATNSAIVDWCRKAGLEIRTPDVREPRFPVLIDKERTA